MFHVTVTIEINVAPAAAFSYIADVSNHPSWQSGIQSTEWTSSPPIRVGSTYDQKLGYRDMVAGYKITAIDPGRSMTIESQEGATIPTSVTRTVEPLGEARCRIRVDLVVQTRGLRRIARPLLVRMTRKSVEADYRRLQRLLEQGPETTE